jgi:signal transduction histidine kinase
MPMTQQSLQVSAYSQQTKLKSDKLMNYFLFGYFIGGLIFAYFYDTWAVAIGVGGLSLLAYYGVKYLLPESNLYQYVCSAVYAAFMAQYIYQMHGLFEMHFVAFIGSAILMTYQNWKLQIPIAAIVVIHHATFGYLQFVGFDKIYFTQLDYMSLRTFVIHAVLATIIFYICGLYAYQLKKLSASHIAQSFEIGRLQIAEAQKEELKKANNELDNFVYSVSHDLRAPLSSMKGVIEITEDETQEEDTRAHMGLLRGSIQKLDRFILDILDYSRNSRLQVKKEKINFKEMLNDITENLKHMAGSKSNVEIKVKVNEKKPFESDKTRLNVILNNLVSNAIRYHNPNVQNPYVSIHIDTSDTEANIVVKDNGIGIQKEQHEKIFDMFYRVSENSVGSGLGLYLVKETVARLNGNITVDSELGRGTEFQILIPNYN